MGHLGQSKKEFWGQTMLEYLQILESKKNKENETEPMDRDGLSEMMKKFPDKK